MKIISYYMLHIRLTYFLNEEIKFAGAYEYEK